MNSFYNKSFSFEDEMMQNFQHVNPLEKDL